MPSKHKRARQKKTATAKKKSATSKKQSVRKSQRKRGRAAAMASSSLSSNGLAAFSVHREDPSGAARFAALERERPGLTAFAFGPTESLAGLDPETAATRHLQQALASEAVPELEAPALNAAHSEFKSLGTETLPLTDTRTVKFRQQVNKIPVYGSLVTVELDQANECLAINSSLGQPKDVDGIAKVAPADAVSAVAKRVGQTPQDVESTPRLYYYYDQSAQKWRLVYILENVADRKAKKVLGAAMPLLYDFVIDAKTGALVNQLPRTPSMAEVVSVQARDGRGQNRTFEVTVSAQGRILRNGALNVATFDFAFGDPDVNEHLLPGNAIRDPWSAAGVSAHANAEEVARFLKSVLKRNGIDNNGGAIISSVNCVVVREAEGQQWLNAFWNSKQMVYGQRTDGDGVRSLAENIDVVGHELFHGVTEFTARLEYANQSGALNESISDIFGILISNLAEPDIGGWNWELGEELLPGGRAFRSMSHPSKFKQPEHMDRYRQLPNTRAGDWGGVHINSGIHNLAMYKLATSRAASGGYLFDAAQLAALYYIALTQYLSRTSGFADCRRALVLAAKTLFRTQASAARDEKVATIEQAYSAVGID